MGSKATVTQLDYFLLLLLVWIQIKQSFSQMSCGPRMSPRLLMEIPCDMSLNTFCTQPGSAYPWSSVRRYIYENQGFMRRMYGEQRQSQVLKDEIEEIRGKYDSIYFYGRGRAQNHNIGFGGRSVSHDMTPTISSATTFSSLNSSFDLMPNKSLERNKTYDSEQKSSPESDSNVNEEGIGVETTEFETSSPTTTGANNHELNDVPNPELYMSSVTPQTTTTNEPKEEQNETQPKKGVNACPIKEEVVAPYWANNTRGEILALLNVYPFEQYIHWEKCAYEGSQMFCRDGCKCEQQYRLHRLLAFDPKNECRGIFADWFRFPSCCVCICYDLPESIRLNRRKARL